MKVSQHSIIVPLLIIFAAFYLLEKYDKRIDILSLFKKTVTKPTKVGKVLYTANKIKKIKKSVIPPPYNNTVTNGSGGNIYDETQYDTRDENVDHDSKIDTVSTDEHQHINERDDTGSLANYSIDGIHDNEIVNGSQHIFEKVQKFDYPLNSSSIKQSSHYVPETKHDSIEIGVNKEFKISQPEEDPIGYENVEHFTYFVGEKFDKLYH